MIFSNYSKGINLGKFIYGNYNSNNMGELEEEIKKKLRLRYGIVSYNNMNVPIETPDLPQIENDIWESMHPFDKDPEMDSLYLIFKYYGFN